MFSSVLSPLLLGAVLVAVSSNPVGPDGSVSGTSSLDGSGTASTATATTTSSPPASASSSGTVNFDAKSPDNPDWNAFLVEVASQTSKSLEELKATAATDPSIAIMWDVYIHSRGDGAALPSMGDIAPAPDTGSAPSSVVSGAGSGPVMVQASPSASAAGSAGTSSDTPSLNQNWFQTFFDNSAGSTANSFSQNSPSQTYDAGLSTNNFGSSGPSINTQPMDQMFDRFRLDSSSSTQQMQPQPNPMALGQQFYSLVSPTLMQTLNPQQTQQTQQTSGGYPTQQQQTSQNSAAPPLSDAALQQLGDELLRLLGKGSAVATTAAPPPAAPTTQAPSQPQFDLGNLANSLAQNLPSPAQPSLPSTSGGQTNSLSQMPGGLGGLGSLGSLGSLGMPGNSIQLGGMPGLPPGPMNPIVNLYQARFKAGASRDLGCRTLGEMLDMDVPRPLNLNCPRLCPAMLGRAMTGKRFGLTCLCCPIYVSDQAIGFRSMQRQAESMA